MDKVTKGVDVGRGEERGGVGREGKRKERKDQRRTESGIRSQISGRKTHESVVSEKVFQDGGNSDQPC